MRVMIVGSGGREFVLGQVLAGPNVALSFVPGNAGTQALGMNLDIDPLDVRGIVLHAVREAVGLVVVGPEAPLAVGLVDALREAGISVFGPTQAAARLEASKAFAKEVMRAAGVPTAGYFVCGDEAAGLAALDAVGVPYVVKVDGLAAGKGVTVTPNRQEAETALRAALAGGGSVVVEECLYGEELSVLAVCDGERALPLLTAQDFKRAWDGEAGPNTGGMGAYAPVAFADAELIDRVRREILQPVLGEMRRRGTPFTGVLYAGLMVDEVGNPRVIEFNVRFGDPEAQVVLPLLARRVDVLRLLVDASHGDLSGWESNAALMETDAAAVTVVLASAGYPGAFEKGVPLRLPVALPDGVTLVHAGTTHTREQVLVTNGGRVVNVTAVAETLAAAREKAYTVIEGMDTDGLVYRRDIAERAVRGAFFARKEVSRG